MFRATNEGSKFGRTASAVLEGPTEKLLCGEGRNWISKTIKRKKHTVKRKNILKIIGIVLLSLLLLFCVISPFVVQYLFDDIFAHTNRRDPTLTASLYYADVDPAAYPREPVSFYSGENLLQGHLYTSGDLDKLVVISHGLGGGEESYLSEALYFIDHGFAVLAYSNTGCWESEGKTSVGLSQSVLDLDAALTWVESEPRFSDVPIYLYGHSWGGYAVTAVLAYDHNITASASVAGFNDPMTMIMEWGEGMMGPLVYLEFPFILINQKLTFGDTLNLTAVDAINSTDTPVLLLHGDQDETVSYHKAGIIASKAQITNPNVEYKVCSNENQNGHNNLFVSVDCTDYVDAKNEEYEAIYEQYDEEVPDEVRREFISKVDKSLANKLDEEFMTTVLDFYQRSAAR